MIFQIITIWNAFIDLHNAITDESLISSLSYLLHFLSCITLLIYSILILFALHWRFTTCYFLASLSSFFFCSTRSFLLLRYILLLICYDNYTIVHFNSMLLLLPLSISLLSLALLCYSHYHVFYFVFSFIFLSRQAVYWFFASPSSKLFLNPVVHQIGYHFWSLFSLLHSLGVIGTSLVFSIRHCFIYPLH